MDQDLREYLEAMEARLYGKLEQRIAESEERVNQRIAESEERVNQRIAESEKRTTDYLLEFRTEVLARFQLIEVRFENVAAALASLELKVPAFSKTIFDFGTILSKTIADQANLAERVTKIEQRLERLSAA